MPVIETETIKRRKIVKGVFTTRGGAKIAVESAEKSTLRLKVSRDSGNGFYFDSDDLREAAALFTELADILEKGE